MIRFLRSRHSPLQNFGGKSIESYLCELLCREQKIDAERRICHTKCAVFDVCSGAVLAAHQAPKIDWQSSLSALSKELRTLSERPLLPYALCSCDETARLLCFAATPDTGTALAVELPCTAVTAARALSLLGLCDGFDRLREEDAPKKAGNLTDELCTYFLDLFALLKGIFAPETPPHIQARWVAALVGCPVPSASDLPPLSTVPTRSACLSNAVVLLCTFLKKRLE